MFNYYLSTGLDDPYLQDYHVEVVCFFYFSLLVKTVVVFHFFEYGTPKQKNPFCQVQLILAKWIWRRRFVKN